MKTQITYYKKQFLLYQGGKKSFNFNNPIVCLAIQICQPPFRKSSREINESINLQ